MVTANSINHLGKCTKRFGKANECVCQLKVDLILYNFSDNIVNTSIQNIMIKRCNRERTLPKVKIYSRTRRELKTQAL